MSSAFRFLSLVAVLTQSRATDSALELLSAEENEFHQRRLDFDDWCNRELANQEKQRKELSELQGDDELEDSEQFEVSEKLLELAKQLEPSPPELKLANLTLAALKAVESDLAARAPRFFFRTRGLEAVQKLLQETRDKVNGFSLAASNRASLETQLDLLKAQEKKSSEDLAAKRAKVLAARSGRKVLETALAQTEASLSEAAGLCGLGRTVLNRSEATGQLLSRKALELIGMVEGSPETAFAATASAASVSAAVPTSAPSDFLAASRQLQQQQQQVQQQLEELKKMKEAQAVQAAQATQATQAPQAAQLKSTEVNLEPEPTRAPRKRSKVPQVTMSLAAETAEASEASHAKIAKIETPTQDVASPAPKAENAEVPAAKVHAKLDMDEDSHRLQAPKDFPAALRGGWQALLAKKRAEGFKKPVKVEEHTSIMDLMQTPKTYTAWQPDKGPAQPEKAKEDLLAAEKAFDDDESDKNMFSKKKSKQSFLQLDEYDSKTLGGADPLAFFQIGSMSDLASTTFAAHSEVAMLLEKFSEMANSSTLLELSKSQLSTKDFEMLLQTLAADSDGDGSEELCASVIVRKETTEAQLKAELKEYYKQAKARHEAQALRREVVAREHLVSVFGNTSQRFKAVEELLQHSFAHEEGRLQRLEGQLVQLEATRNAHNAAQELHSVLGQLRTTMHHAQEELEDTLASATSRQQQAEKMDQQSLQKLVVHVKDVEGSAKSRPPSGKLEKLCTMAAASRATRREKHQMELEALRAAKALNELL